MGIKIALMDVNSSIIIVKAITKMSTLFSPVYECAEAAETAVGPTCLSPLCYILQTVHVIAKLDLTNALAVFIKKLC